MSAEIILWFPTIASSSQRFRFSWKPAFFFLNRVDVLDLDLNHLIFHEKNIARRNSYWCLIYLMRRLSEKFKFTIRVPKFVLFVIRCSFVAHCWRRNGQMQVAVFVASGFITQKPLELWFISSKQDISFTLFRKLSNNKFIHKEYVDLAIYRFG